MAKPLKFLHTALNTYTIHFTDEKDAKQIIHPTKHETIISGVNSSVDIKLTVPIIDHEIETLIVSETIFYDGLNVQTKNGYIEVHLLSSFDRKDEHDATKIINICKTKTSELLTHYSFLNMNDLVTVTDEMDKSSRSIRTSDNDICNFTYNTTSKFVNIEIHCNYKISLRIVNDKLTIVSMSIKIIDVLHYPSLEKN